jgi:hypothetical protein
MSAAEDEEDVHGDDAAVEKLAKVAGEAEGADVGGDDPKSGVGADTGEVVDSADDCGPGWIEAGHCGDV